VSDGWQRASVGVVGAETFVLAELPQPDNKQAHKAETSN
jgi:hypothetical protein